MPVFWNSLFDIQIGRKRNVDGFVLADRAPLRGGSMRQLTVTYLKYHRSRRCEAREQVCLGLVNKTADPLVKASLSESDQSGQTLIFYNLRV